MILFPAIDLYEQKAVRLYKGDYRQMTVYNENPLSVAQDFRAAGASWVHMVDLEGARDGGTPNASVIASVAANTGLNVEVGGGIRSLDTVKQYLDLGVKRVILGTAAFADETFLKQALRQFGSQIAVSVDCRDGFVATHGWVNTTDMDCNTFCQKLQDLGVRTVICTDISKDGAMRGTNRALYAQLSQKFSIDFIASGGVSSLEDIRALRALDLYGAIVGKAYYTGAISLAEAIEVAK